MDYNKESQEKLMNRQSWQSVHVLASREDWDSVKQYLSLSISRCHAQMESCSTEDLKVLQGNIEAYRNILHLRDKAKKEMALLPH